MNTNLARVTTHSYGNVISVDWKELCKQHNELNKPQEENKNNSKETDIKTKRKAVNGTVDPIREKEDIQAIKDYFFNHVNKRTQNKSHGIRNWCMWSLNICLGLRAGDLLALTISNILNENGTIKDSIVLKEEKTKKRRELFLSDNAKFAIETYLEYRNIQTPYQTNDFLFESNKKKWDEDKQEFVSQPIEVRSCWRILNDAGKALGFDKKNIKIGSHSMRKTFGTQFMKINENDEDALTYLSEMFNHSNEKITRKYIGMTSERNKKLYTNCNF